MLIDFIASVIERDLGYSPTRSQIETIRGLARFIANADSSDSVFVLKGYAGTGKTSLVKAVVHGLEKLRIRCQLMAPTGRAAKVLSLYANRSASTVHRKIYRQRSLSSANSTFDLDINVDVNTVFIVDEASMLSGQFSDSMFGSGNVLDDLFRYVYRNGCRMIFVGDVAQLPPVHGADSPALDTDYLAKQYLMDVYSVELSDVVRQAENSGILFNATKLRTIIDSRGKVKLSLQVDRFPDVVRLSGDQLVDTIANSYDSCGVGETVLITRSNKRANQFNQGIRQMVQWKDSQIGIGDYIMVVKNNYEGYAEYGEIDFVANGDVAEIRSVSNFQELFGLHFADAVLSFPDYNGLEIEKKIILDTLTAETPALTVEQNKSFFLNVEQDYVGERNKKRRYEKIRKDPFFSALQVKFAYAITCHKSQGGQWKHVYVDHGYCPETLVDSDFLRWLYTAFTRAQSKLFLVNFKEEFFVDQNN